ncbi:MAG: four helix bundle protein [Ignavibacteria bacterium]|nr:four helix bundle protein [Ignavibacteria bacterium]
MREAKFAESRRDFVHKLKIAEKELAEFYFWIGLLHDNPSAISEENTGTLLDLAADTRHLLKSIIIATRQLRPIATPIAQPQRNCVTIVTE